ncbi:ribulose bisphosphate carboxylase small subunit [soil metagenome]
MQRQQTTMRLRRGQFSYLPDLADDEIAAQIRYAIDNGWAVGVEYTDDPHPRNTYWEMWDRPLFDLTAPTSAIAQINDCRQTFPEHYVAVTAYDSTLARQVKTMWFIVQRPSHEPGFELDRTTFHGRTQLYAQRPHTVDRH